MKKRIILFLLIMCTVMYAPSNAFSFEFTQLVISDTDEHWSEEAISTLASLDIMNGYNGYTNPDDIITRGEFTALITRAFKLTASTNTQYFKDIDKGHIFFENVSAAHEYKIVDGFPDRTFRADNMITREEIILIISRLTADNERSSNVDFTDITDSYPYMSQLSKVMTDGIITGYPDGSFKPYGKTTRAEAATIILNAMKKYIASNSQNNAYEVAVAFLNEHFSNVHSYTIGSAKDDSEYIDYTYKKAKALGYNVANRVSYISIIENINDGPFSKITANYVVECNVNDYTKIYTGQSDIRLITQNNKTYVYEHNSRIIKQKKINLTWEIYATPPSYETAGVNVVSPTCFEISDANEYGGNQEKIYSESGKEFVFNSSLTDNYVSYAKNKGYEIWAMYKTNFNTDLTSDFLNSRYTRRQAADILLKNMLRYSLDGINFDFENMYRYDKGVYTNHVKEIAVMAHVVGATVSVDVTKYEPTSYTWSMCYDRDALAKSADYIALMAYDQYYSGSKTPGPVSGLGWTEEVIKLTLGEVPTDKLLLGMPYYIRCWQVNNGKVVKSEALSMAKAIKYVTENNAYAVYDEKFGLTKYSWTKDGKDYVLWMENAESIAKRAEICKKYALAGVASWRRGFETPDVWNALQNALFS